MNSPYPEKGPAEYEFNCPAEIAEMVEILITIDNHAAWRAQPFL